jgi:hypothetical protein
VIDGHGIIRWVNAVRLRQGHRVIGTQLEAVAVARREHLVAQQRSV